MSNFIEKYPSETSIGRASFIPLRKSLEMDKEELQRRLDKINKLLSLLDENNKLEEFYNLVREAQ